MSVDRHFPQQRTSALAQASLSEPSLATQRERVLDYIARHCVVSFVTNGDEQPNLFARIEACGATDEEIQEALGLDGSTERPRRQELLKAGLIVDSQLRRKTHSGRLAIVWSAV